MQLFFGVSVKLFNRLVINIGHGQVMAARADDELCIDRLHLFTLLFLNYTSSVVKINDALLRKIEIRPISSVFFFLLWRSRSFINWSQQFLQHMDSIP